MRVATTQAARLPLEPCGRGDHRAGRAVGSPGTCVARGPRQEDRGATLVEFALVIPVLLILLFGLIDFGYSWSQNLSVKHAAREGARLASVDAETDAGSVGSDCTALVTLIKQRVSAELGSTLTVSITFSGTAKTGDTGTIRVTYPRSSLTGFTTALKGGTMSSSVLFRMEQSANFVNSATSGTSCP